jgi:triacylglycerol lipase
MIAHPDGSVRSLLSSLALAGALLCAALAGCGGPAELGSAAGATSDPAASAADPSSTTPDLATGTLPRAPHATVVLIHGMGGFKKIAGLDYFYQVPGDWRAAGAKVVVPGTTTIASVEKRAAELKAQLDEVPGKLVLVAHSQGGLDARWLISKLGYADRVLALVTIATPHHGTPLADLLLGAAGSKATAAADALIGVLGWSLDGAREMTVDNMEHRFNPSVPDAPGVTYLSYSGSAAPFGAGHKGWLHAELLASWAILDSGHIDSDGVVPEASGHWGAFQGAVPADHVGECGQPLSFTPGFDHRAFYRGLLQRMHDAGW